MSQARERVAWIGLAVVGMLLVAALAGVVRGGPLDPPGVPGPTQKGQIASLPAFISEPGSYSVTADLTGGVGSVGITINSDDVTVDLQGFTIRGPGGAGLENGISAISRNNITVKNGLLRDWGGNGAYVVQGQNTRLEDLDAYHNGFNGTAPFTGFGLNTGSSSSAVVSGCTLSLNGRVGQGGGLNADGGAEVTTCSATGNPGTGFIVNRSSVIGCVASANGVGIKTSGSLISGCHLNGNTNNGIEPTHIM